MTLPLGQPVAPLRRRVERPGPAEDVQASGERRRAARALLLHPLLLAEGPQADEFRLVRRHRDDLERLFAEGLGYRLVVEPRAARLFKAGLGRDGSRPLRRRTRERQPVTPRTYALLCLVLAALTRSKEQLLLDELVAEVRSALTESGLDVDLDAAVDRRAMHAALLALVDLGVLVERDGDLSRWAEDARAQSLLDVSRERLRLLVAAPLSSVSGPDDLLDAAALPSAAGGARVAVRRRLLESPVLSVTDLPADQAEWWSRNRNREREWLRDKFGLELELRAEGALAVDAEGELTDIAFPGTGSGRHVALLLLERLVTAVRDRACGADLAVRVWWPVADEVLAKSLSEVRAEFGAGLRRAHREDLGVMRREALGVLCAAGLVREVPVSAGQAPSHLWEVHAAGARYAARPELLAAGAGGERSLFDEGD